MKRTIATDLDGTLLYPRSFAFVPRKNVKFLRDFIDDNGHVVIITSRGLMFARNVEKKIRRSIDTICANGAIITHNKEIIRQNPIENKLAAEIIDLFNGKYRRRGQGVFIATDEYGMIIDPKNTGIITGVGSWIWTHLHGVNSEKFKLSNKKFKENVKSGIIYKVVVFNGISKKNRHESQTLASKFKERYPELEVMWTDYITEITAKDCNKARGLQIYQERCGLEKDDIIVVGDSENDIPMFEAYPEHSFAMAQGRDSVKEKAKYQIRRFYELQNHKEILER